MNVCIYMTGPFVVQQKLIEHCKSTIIIKIEKYISRNCLFWHPKLGGLMCFVSLGALEAQSR